MLPFLYKTKSNTTKGTFLTNLCSAKNCKSYSAENLTVIWRKKYTRLNKTNTSWDPTGNSTIKQNSFGIPSLLTDVKAPRPMGAGLLHPWLRPVPINADIQQPHGPRGLIQKFLLALLQTTRNCRSLERGKNREEEKKKEWKKIGRTLISLYRWETTIHK